jgi:hypothetical protein
MGKLYYRVSESVGLHPWGRLWLFGGRELFVRDIFILNETQMQDKIYFGRHFAWLKYFTYHLC